MSKKNKPDNMGFVYSTNPNFSFDHQNQSPQETLPPAHQKLRIQLQTKHRAGKAVTVVMGFIGVEDDLQQLAKQLKNSCGTGGSAKDAEIIIQGDQRDKILQWLQKNGYTNAKKI